MKFFFQGISWNAGSGSFHETRNTFMKCFYFSIQHSEAVVQMCSVKKVFLEISQNLQENVCTRVSFLIKLQIWGQGLFFNKVAGHSRRSRIHKQPPEVFLKLFANFTWKHLSWSLFSFWKLKISFTEMFHESVKKQFNWNLM